MRLKNFVKGDLNDLFYREYRLKRKVKRHLIPYYTEQAPLPCNKEKIIIFMADGRKRHGGLADRLRGIVSTYKYCLEHQIDFRIHFISPFQLEELLIPNKYCWKIQENEISYNSSSSLPVYINSNLHSKNDKAFQRKMAEKYFAKDYKQIHVYTNMYYADDEFGALFNELFRPAPALQAWVDENFRLIGEKYIAFSFRFIGLLGDFCEGKKYSLSLDKREELCNKCINKVIELRRIHPEVHKFLVTADSEYFLRQIAKLDFVHVLPGKVGHMDNIVQDNLEVHMKTFLDFFMLSKSQKIYLLVTDNMYKSGFARRASKLNGVLFEEIIF